MNKIVKILMERDDITEQEAIDLLNETREMCQEAINEGNDCEAEEIWIEMLGLELDYFVDFLLD